MNGPIQEPVKRWTAQWKTGLALDIIKGKTTVPEVSRSHDLISSEIEGWIEGGKRHSGTPCGPGRSMSASRHSVTSKRHMARPCRSLAPEKICNPCWMWRKRNDPMCSAGSCRGWVCDVGDQTVCQVRHAASHVLLQADQGSAPPKVDPRLAGPTEVLIDQHTSFARRTLARIPGFHKNTGQRVLQSKNRQVKMRSFGAGLNTEALPSVADAPNEY